MPARLLLAMLLALAVVPARAIDVSALWDFRRPEISEQRFREALERASGDDALILQTQIARTHGLRRDFEQGRALLLRLTGTAAAAGPEARAWYALELGRTHASATHDSAQLTPAARAEAGRLFLQARDFAQAAGNDALAVDALHMMVFAEPEPARQVEWNRRALARAVSSDQPAAHRWEGSLRNNLGLALRDSGRPAEALVQFERLVELRQRQGDAQRGRIARWQVARTLRALGRVAEALPIQLALEQEFDALGQPDRYVFDELEVLYRARDDHARADQYARRSAAHAR